MKLFKNRLLATTFHALKYRNYRLFFFGQGLSLIGTWMQIMATSWLVYRMTDSVFLLGFIGFISQIPLFILSPFTGTLSDRFNKHKIMVICQFLFMIQAVILTVLTLTGKVQIWHIIVLDAFMGIINSLEIPTRHSFVIEMVERKEVLGNAIALNSMSFNFARLVGPAIAGLVVAAIGEGLCFLINSLSYIVVLISLVLMKITHKQTQDKSAKIMDSIAEGIKYTFGFPPIRAIILLVSVVSIVGAAFSVLMPFYAKDVLKGGPDTLGFLTASVGFGSLIATIHIASKRNFIKFGRIIPLSAVLLSVSVIFFAFSKILWVSLLLMALTGFGLMVNLTASNTILQVICDDDKRGRVMSFYSMAFLGIAPIGCLIVGYFATAAGAIPTLVISGLLCIIASTMFHANIPGLKKIVKPVYDRLETM